MARTARRWPSHYYVTRWSEWPPPPSTPRSILVREDDDQEHDQREQHQQRDLPRALRILPRHPAGVAVDDDLVAPAPVQIGQEPHRDENVLERPAGKHRADFETAVGVARNFAGRHLEQLARHRLLGVLGCFE